VKRREFILIPAKALGGLVLYSLVGELVPAPAEDGIKVPLRFFTAAEAQVIQAASERIIPTDESGPGATEAGVVIYIDRQLASPYGQDKRRYTKGPWIESIPEHGYQGKETPQQVYRDGIGLLGADFATVPAEQQDLRLEKIEGAHFFQLLRTHTIEGMFCDPMHGGNIGMVGWKLIGFPGPRMNYRDQIDKHFGQAYTLDPMSLEQILRHPVKGAEDEEDW
jgi:gluconate 2-dehydrogenase gamma chain